MTRRELDERLPRSAPDALRNEPGVYIQQTAHGQASPYVRGLTGQQTVMLFDGVRLNNSTFRQGPNQYFFTVDARSIQKLEVIRGSASTRYGSDAMGGAILTTPIEPSLEVGKRRLVAHSRAIAQTATADGAYGGRAQLDLSYKGKLGLYGGVGYRRLGLLRAGGRIIAPATGDPQKAPPLFLHGDNVQAGTGFKELAGDVRLVYEPNPRHRLTVAYYDYRQYDAPRTDRCPPPTAPQDECLTYNEQFRTLVYAKYAMRGGPPAAERLTWTVSYQRQHEDRLYRRGSPSPTRLTGVDNVHSVGTALQASTKAFELAPWANLTVHYGADGYFDRVTSAASQFYATTKIRQDDPWTQYTDGARYFTSGAWMIGELLMTRYLRLRLGGRGAAVFAKAPGDVVRVSAPVNRYWLAGVTTAGVRVTPTPWLAFLLSVDQGFRAPNIDDLTSRQLTGPGFQYENDGLKHEKATMFEGGIRIQHRWIELSAFGFQSWIDDYIQRASRDISACPAGDPNCSSSRYRFQLVNTPGTAILRGADGGIRVYLPADLSAAATFSYAWGESPNPEFGIIPNTPRRAPLSRVPPLHGSAEAGWRSTRWGVHLVGALRWARPQSRLAIQDLRDIRIPDGGTPGFVVFDLRAGYRYDPHVLLGLVFENVADAAYRHHGSSVNGAGRGLIFEAQFGF